MPDSLHNDLPPGAPAYAAGPLANTPAVPSLAALRASGQAPNQFLAPVPIPLPPSPQQISTSTTPLTLGDRAAALVERARAGITNLLGGQTSVPTPLPQYAPALTDNRRTATLEKGLDELEKRSTRPAPTFYEQQRLATSR